MNLKDLLDPEYGLQQDKWSLGRPKFGDEGQLQVIGWSMWTRNSHKLYILKCEKCSKDTELFGEGYFKSQKSSISKAGQIPCGCSKNPKWTEDQYRVFCSRKAKELDYTFLGFEGEWKGAYTRTQMFCKHHGIWNTTAIHDLINKGVGCSACNGGVPKSEDIMIKSFLDSGSFPLDTKFWRSGRKNNEGVKVYWAYTCSVCKEEGEAQSSDLQRGVRSCACSQNRQKECYINLVMDGNLEVALKFGIAKNSIRRAKEQNSQSVYNVVQHSIYEFPSVASCKKAERECKKELECGVVLKRDMPDGYSETTYPYNIEKIKRIYEKHGGIELCHLL